MASLKDLKDRISAFINPVVNFGKGAIGGTINDVKTNFLNLGQGINTGLQIGTQAAANRRFDQLMRSKDLADMAARGVGNPQQFLTESRRIDQAPSLTRTIASFNQPLANFNLQSRLTTGMEGAVGNGGALKTLGRGFAPGVRSVATGLGLQRIAAAPLSAGSYFAPAIGATFGGIGAKLQGQDVATGIGQGLASGVRTLGFTSKFTDPAIDWAAGGRMAGMSELRKQLTRRSITGLGNMLEDELLAKMEGTKQGAAERLLSFGLGAFISPQANSDLIKKLKSIGFTPKEAEQGAKVIKETVDNNFVKNPNMPNGVIRESGLNPKPELPANPKNKKIITTRNGKPVTDRELNGLNAFVGASAGFEPEYDENGKFIGYKYNPVKGAIGMGVGFGAGMIKSKTGELPTTKQAPQPQQINKTETQVKLPQEAISQQKTIDQSLSPLKTSSSEIINPQSTGVGQRAPQELNVSNLDLNLEQKMMIQDVTANDVKQKLSNEQIKKIAESAGFDTKTNNIDQTAQKIAEQYNTRRQVVELTNQYETLKSSGATEDQLAEQLRKIADQADISTKQGTDIARQLQARRIMANEIDTPMQKVFKILDEAGVNRDVYTRKAVGVDFNDGKQVLEYYRSLVPAKAKDWIDLIRYNSMLSSPNTALYNASANFQGTAVIAPIEKTITGFIDKIRSGITGSPRQALTGEGLAYTKGFYSNFGKATRSFLDVMRGNDVELGTSFDVRQAPLATGGIEKKIADHLSFPMKIQTATDKFFRTLAFEGEKSALEYRKSRGIKIGTSIEDQAMKNANRRLFISELGQNEGSKVLDAVDTLANVVQQMKGSKNPIVSTVAKFSLPFVKTPTNILKQGIEYTPLGVSTMWGSQHKTEQLAKALMGTAFGAAIGMLVGNDSITWGEPTSEKQRNAFRAAGMQPYSVKIGSNWVSYSKLHPAISFPIALVAAVKNAQDNKRISESDADTVLNGAAKFVNFFIDQSYMKSVGDMVSGLKGSAEDMSRIPANFATQMIPWRAAMSWINRIIDPYQRQVDKDGSILDQQLQNIASQIPLFSYSVPARLDQYNQPIVNQNGLLNALNPIGKITTENPQMKADYNLMMEKSKLNRQKSDLKKMIESGKDITGVKTASANENLLYTPVVKPGDVYKETNTLDQNKMDVEKLRFDVSGETAKKVSDTQYFIRNDSGTIDTIDLSKDITAPTYSGNKLIDDKRKSQYKSKINTRINDLVKLVDAGLMSEEDALKEIESLNSKTGETKKAKAITIKQTKVSLPGLTKTAKRSMPTFKISSPKFKGIKAPKLKSVKVKRPKSIKIKARSIRNTLNPGSKLI